MKKKIIIINYISSVKKILRTKVTGSNVIKYFIIKSLFKISINYKDINFLLLKIFFISKITPFCLSFSNEEKYSFFCD